MVQLALENIYKAFGSQKLLEDISVSFYHSEITGITGGNGEGKTTLLNIICGLVPPSSGRIRLGDKDITSQSIPQIAKLGIARLFQEVRLFPSMTVLENIIVGIGERFGEKPLRGLLFPSTAKADNVRCIEEARNLLQLFGFEKDEDKFPTMLSFGERKLLAITVLLSRKPTALLLDEPAAGLSQKNLNKLTELLYKLKTEEKIVVIVEHVHNFIDRICDRIIIIKEGHLTEEPKHLAKASNADN
jgi:branched-chain amino acid transport system ATP-binding protein